jgi:nickel/cobalt transporter (NicO) family protein
MRALILITAAVALATAVWLFAFGGAAVLAQQAAEVQRSVQNAMAGALRRLQGGDPAALMTLWTLCFGYGFVHAAGPGHGKLVLGAYAMGTRVPVLRVSVLAVLSSLAQAVTAILLVGVGLTALGWGHQQLQALADRDLARLSALLITLIGGWLVWRGARRFWRVRGGGQTDLSVYPSPPQVAQTDRSVYHSPVPGGQTDLSTLGTALTTPEICPDCGHAHGPSIHQAAEVRSLRDAVLLIGAIAVRPCTGALFLLILTWQIGIFWAGILGALVMALGTATVTLVVAIAAVSLRESALMQVAAGTGTLRLMAGIEALVGLMVIVIAGQMLV